MSENNLPEQSNKYSDEELKEMRKRGLPKPHGVTWTRWNQPFKLNPNHERMCYMAATGMSKVRIAEECGTTPVRVGQVLEGDSAKFRIKEIQFEIYGQNPQKRFEGMVSNAIDTISDIMNNPTNRASVRRGAANDILDRALGKPVQAIEHRDSTIRDIFNKLDEIMPKDVVDANYSDITDVEFKEVYPKDEEEEKVDEWLGEIYEKEEKPEEKQDQ